MKKIDLAIVIIGKICSGKSTLSKKLSSELNIPIASFGNYLYTISQEMSLPTDRESLQDLGTKLINESYRDFLENVITHVPNQTNKLIFEGVRHKVIFEEIKRISNRMISFYLEVENKERLRRFLNREKVIDLSANEDTFNERNKHQVESEVDILKSYCDYRILSTDNAFEIMKEKILEISSASNIN